MHSVNMMVVALSGGPVLLGDDLTTLPEERLEMYTLCLPANGIAARPVDLFKNDHPRIWDLKVEADWGQWHVVGQTLSGICHRAPGATGKIFFHGPDGCRATKLQLDEGACRLRGVRSRQPPPGVTPCYPQRTGSRSRKKIA